ncbi:MAG: hypothetical protein JOY68_09345 [Candidatus Dormibacteraeota bacterium]|nr:hypothetical protein [Candidatus Dormibacteraeota bacterium]MBV8445120.1 hypothetical protein [Candidatus Dormibacteraeota bacterium]
MPWLRRGRDATTLETAPSIDEATLELARREGTYPCTSAGCTAVTGLPCEYVDRRDRHCRTAWCPLHRVIVEQHVYCRRHAGIIAALPSGETVTLPPLPDLENRAPSLAGWMGKQLDPDVWEIMLRELEQEAGGQLVSDPVSLVFVGIDRQRAWERAWTLALQNGDRRRVSVVVEEIADEEVVVKVGPNVVDRLIPPWILHRRQGEQVAEEQDTSEREAFNQRVLDAMERGLARERELARQTRAAEAQRYVPAPEPGHDR